MYKREKGILKEEINEIDVLNFLNGVNAENGFNEIETYHDGSILNISLDKQKYGEELSKIVNDVEKYRDLNNERYTHDEDNNIIGLSYLLEIIGQCFGSEYSSIEIKYDQEKDEFYLD